TSPRGEELLAARGEGEERAVLPDPSPALRAPSPRSAGRGGLEDPSPALRASSPRSAGRGGRPRYTPRPEPGNGALFGRILLVGIRFGRRGLTHGPQGFEDLVELPLQDTEPIFDRLFRRSAQPDALARPQRLFRQEAPCRLLGRQLLVL